VSAHVQNDDQPRSISRRRLVRTTATVAWAVPAVQLATAVPAFATSGSGCCDLLVSGTPSWRGDDLNYIDIPLLITNGCSDPVHGLTVTLKVCGVEGITYSGASLPAGWVQGGKANKPLTPDGDGCYTLLYTTPGSVPSGSTSLPLTLKTQAYVGSGAKRPAGTVTVTVATGGCAPVSTTQPLASVG